MAARVEGTLAQARVLGVVAESALTVKESRRVVILMPDGDVHVEDASGQGRELRASAGARIVRCLVGFAGKVLTPSAASSETFNFDALKRPQLLRHGLTSIDATQTSLIPWMEFGGRSSGSRDFCRNGIPPVFARGEGDWRALETVGDIPRVQLRTKTDWFCDLGELWTSGWFATRWVHPGELPPLPLNNSRVFPLAFLPFRHGKA